MYESRGWRKPLLESQYICRLTCSLDLENVSANTINSSIGGTAGLAWDAEAMLFNSFCNFLVQNFHMTLAHRDVRSDA